MDPTTLIGESSDSSTCCQCGAYWCEAKDSCSSYLFGDYLAPAWHQTNKNASYYIDSSDYRIPSRPNGTCDLDSSGNFRAFEGRDHVQGLCGTCVQLPKPLPSYLNSGSIFEYSTLPNGYDPSRTIWFSKWGLWVRERPFEFATQGLQTPGKFVNAFISNHQSPPSDAGTWKPSYLWVWPMCHLAAQVTQVPSMAKFGNSSYIRGQQTVGTARIVAQDEKAALMQKLTATDGNAVSHSVSNRRGKCAMMCYRGTNDTQSVDNAGTASRCGNGTLVTAQHPIAAQFCCYEGCPESLDKWYAFGGEMCAPALQLN